MTFADFALQLVFNSLWQTPIIATLAFLGLRLVKDAQAATRCTVYALALFAAGIAPFATMSALGAGSPPAASRLTITLPLPSAQLAENATGASRATASPIKREDLLAAGAASWLAVAVFLYLRLLYEFARLQRLKNDVSVVEPGLEAIARTCCPDRAFDIAVSPNVSLPTAIGFVRPMILLPDGLLDRLSRADVERIVLHEVAHLRRYDDWSLLAQRCVQATFFFNPFVHALDRAVGVEREMACDDWVVSRTAEPDAYAASLVNLAKLSLSGAPPSSLASSLLTRRSIVARVNRLVAREGVASPPAAPLVLLPAIVLSGALVAALATPRLVAAHAEATAKNPITQVFVRFDSTRSHVGMQVPRDARTDEVEKLAKRLPESAAIRSLSELILHDRAVHVRRAAARALLPHVGNSAVRDTFIDVALHDDTALQVIAVAALLPYADSDGRVGDAMKTLRKNPKTQIVDVLLTATRRY
ncbi:MAG TPA: M56 family metallopeptidase [Gemmatimonadaceae bacterium]